MQQNILDIILKEPTQFFNLSDEDMREYGSGSRLVYRYFNKAKSLSLLTKSELFLAHYKNWEDKFEGQLFTYWNLINKVSVPDELLRMICFTDDVESDLIWKAYCDDCSGMKVGFDLSVLVRELEANVCGKILYLKNDETVKIIEDMMLKIPSDHAHKLLFVKLRAYHSENEVRVMKVVGDKYEDMPYVCNVDLVKCIKSIVINPRASDEDCQEITECIDRVGLKHVISQSEYYGYNWDFMMMAARKRIERGW